MYRDLQYTCTLVFPPTPQYPQGRRLNRAGKASGYLTGREQLTELIKHPFGDDVQVAELKGKDADGKELA